MEKRFFLFLILSMAVMTGYVLLQNALAPPVPIGQEPVAAGPDQVVGGDPAGDEPATDGPATDGPATDGPATDGPAIDGPPADNQTPSTDPQVPSSGETPLAESPVSPDGTGAAPAELFAPELPPAWTTVEAQGGPLRVTFSNHAAGVVGVELIERTRAGGLRYRSVDDTRPYLGFLILDDFVGGGAIVRHVPAGSPAAQAGLLPGDVITQLDNHPVSDEAGFQRQLADLSSQATILVQFRRGENETAPVSTISIQAQQRPLAVIEPERDKAGVLVHHPASFRLDVASLAGKSVNDNDAQFEPLRRLMSDNWQMKVLDGSEPVVEFRLPMTARQLAPLGIAGDLEWVKRFRLAAPNDSKQAAYHLTMDVEVVNKSDQDVKVSLGLWGGNSLTTEGWWYQNKLHPRMFYVAGARDVVRGDGNGSMQFLGTRDIYTEAKKRADKPRTVLFGASEPADQRSLHYLASDTQYFSVALLPAQFRDRQLMQFASADALLVGTPTDDKYRIKLENTTFRVATESAAAPAKSSLVRSYTWFCGPKRDEVLAEYGLESLIYRGWFSVFTQAASAILHVLYMVVRNYGIAIILLTVLVRGAMFPIGRKAALNAQKMQELSPEIKKISEKHKNDVQKRGEEVAALYKKHNFNPMSGCGLMFFQLPVFLGLYRCLAVDINLRQSSFIPGLDWCSNLAGPDKLWNWTKYLPEILTGEASGYLGPYLNVLPIITIALFLVQQKMFTPPPTDDQSRMQQQVMKYMMIFMCIMFFKVPAGLCIYFIASSVWGIAERKLLPKPAPPNDQKQQEVVKKVVEAKKARLRANRR